jgi:hypothetical protein
VAKKDGSAPDLKAAHQSNNASEKEDDRKPAAVAKKMDNTTLKMKDPPTKRVDEEDQTDDKKPAAKENVQDKKKRRNAKLPLYPNSMRLLPKSIGKSPNMDLDLEDTESESDDEILEDKPKPWKLITTLKEREICNLKQAAKDRRRRGYRVRSIPDKADFGGFEGFKKTKTGREEARNYTRTSGESLQRRIDEAQTGNCKRKHAGAPKRHRKVYGHSTPDVEKGCSAKCTE